MPLVDPCLIRSAAPSGDLVVRLAWIHRLA